MNAPFELPHAELGDDTELRAELKRHIEQRNLAQQRRDQIADACERATTFIAKLESDLAAFADADMRIARQRAERFKQVLVDADAAPMSPLSPELAAAAAKKLDAENQLTAARQAHAALTGALNEEQATLDRLRAGVVAAAKRVVGFHSDLMAVQMMTLETQAGELRQKLLGVTATRTPDKGQFPLQASTFGLLRDVPCNSIYNRNRGVSAAHWWDRFQAKLLLDSEAQPDEIEAIRCMASSWPSFLLAQVPLGPCRRLKAPLRRRSPGTTGAPDEDQTRKRVCWSPLSLVRKSRRFIYS